MASTSETGHVINIANFKLMIDTVAAFGPDYTPSNSNLSVVSMTTKWTAADAAQTTMTTALQNSKTPINEREILFEPLNKLVTRTLNIFRSTPASSQIKKDAKGLGDK